MISYIVRYIRKLSIRVQLSFITIMIIVSMIIIILTSYYQLNHVIENKNREYYNQLITQTNQTILSNTDSINRLIKNIAYNKLIVQEYLSETDRSKQFEKYIQLRDYLNDMINLKDGIIDIAIIGNNGTTININGDISQLIALKKEIPENVLYYYSGIKNMTFGPNRVDNKMVFIAGTRIYSITNFSPESRELGFLMITMHPEAIMSSQDKIEELADTNMYMLDRDGQVFFTNDPMIATGSLYSESVTDDEQLIVQSGDIPDIEGKIIYKILKSNLLKGIDGIRQQQLVIFFVAIVLLLIPYSFVINNILSPLKKLMQFMKEVNSGKLKTLKNRVEVSGYAEIVVMSNEFNSMLDEINELTHRLFETTSNLYETELVKQQSEMAYLKSQINPHFLYNTLESIKGIAVEEGVDRIFNMANALAQIFRYCIKGSDLVVLDNEMSIIKQYLYIQKIRFGSRLEITYDFMQEALTTIIPKMLLQPIVENAIYHGIEPKFGVGHLEIKAQVNNRTLTISIIDDGVGIKKEILAGINRDLSVRQNLLKRAQQNQNESIGIMNVNNQIKLLYGDEYGVEMYSELEKGTQAIIRIPLRSEKDV